MKKLLYTLLAISLIFSACKEEVVAPTNNTGNNSMQTYVPDDNFEQRLINLGLDNILDNYVTTSSIDTVLYLNLNNYNNISNNISDLTGIEDFESLDAFECRSNNLISIDLSYNSNLIYLHCAGNEMINLNLGSTDIEIIYCWDNNIVNLDLSNNGNLKEIYANQNNLVSLNLKNGNSSNISFIALYDNPNLSCILVDDPNAMNNALGPFDNDPQHYLSNSCP
tara:strand:+ start:58 stop:726 length:669 start_codon:yes stop_codon:yes gene_type:complete